MSFLQDTAGNSTKREREVRAADRIFGLLPEEQARQMRDLWEEFEEGITPEARFANTLDKVQPIMLNDATGGIAWREHGVKVSQVMGRNARTAEGSQQLWEYAKSLIEKNTGTNIIPE